MSILAKTVVGAIALWIVSLLFTSVYVLPHDAAPVIKILIFLLLGFILALVNTIIKPIIKVLSLPFYILTLGLFGLIINALMLMLVSWLTSSSNFGLHVEGFWAAVWAGLVLSVLSSIISIPFRKR